MSNYEINVLVNGSRCKIYSHNGKRFIEAKSGSNYVLEIKNNSYNRVLSVSSVDSLNTITGKNEDALTGAGYVINGYTSVKIDGFRISDNEVSQFKFDVKSKGYAASKKDGSERNVGVIGVRIFNEKIKPTVSYTKYNNDYLSCDNTNPSKYYNDITWGSSIHSQTMCNASNCTSNSSIGGLYGDGKYGYNINNVVQNYPIEPRGFDMSTSFGEAKESKVIEVEFERQNIIDSIDIYYATRESLIEMGVPITSEKQVAFPEPFKESRYCEPPKNWKP